MNRYQFIQTLQDKLQKHKAEIVDEGVKIIFSSMSTAIIKGERIEIRGFGAFSTKRISAKVARDPRTGKNINVPAKRRVHFKSGKDLKESVNKEQDIDL